MKITTAMKNRIAKIEETEIQKDPVSAMKELAEIHYRLSVINTMRSFIKVAEALPSLNECKAHYNAFTRYCKSLAFDTEGIEGMEQEQCNQIVTAWNSFLDAFKSSHKHMKKRFKESDFSPEEYAAQFKLNIVSLLVIWNGGRKSVQDVKM